MLNTMIDVKMKKTNITEWKKFLTVMLKIEQSS
jgi:hypothetical protein